MSGKSLNLAPALFRGFYQGEEVRTQLGWGWHERADMGCYKLIKTVDLFEHPFKTWPFTTKFMCYRAAIKDIIVGEETFIVLSDNGVCGAYDLKSFDFLGYINPTSSSVVKCAWYLKNSSVFVITYVTENENFDVLRAYSINEHNIMLRQFHAVVLLFSSSIFRRNSFIEYDFITGTCLTYSDPTPFNRDNHLYQIYKEKEKAFVRLYKCNPTKSFNESKLSFGSALLASTCEYCNRDNIHVKKTNKGVNKDEILNLNIMVISKDTTQEETEGINFNINIKNAVVEIMEWSNNKLLFKQKENDLQLYDEEGKIVNIFPGYKNEKLKIVNNIGGSLIIMYGTISGLIIFDLCQAHSKNYADVIKTHKIIDKRLMENWEYSCVYPVTDTTLLLFSSDTVTSRFRLGNIIPPRIKIGLQRCWGFQDLEIQKLTRCKSPDIFTPIILYNIVHDTSIQLIEVNKESTSAISAKFVGMKCGEKKVGWKDLYCNGILFVGSDTGVVDIYSI